MYRIKYDIFVTNNTDVLRSTTNATHRRTYTLTHSFENGKPQVTNKTSNELIKSSVTLVTGMILGIVLTGSKTLSITKK